MKIEYTKPVLSELGSVADLTEASSFGATPDGAPLDANGHLPTVSAA